MQINAKAKSKAATPKARSRRTTAPPTPSADGPDVQLVAVDSAAAPPPPPSKPVPNGKLGTLVELMSRSQGATIEDMSRATGWQAHSVRGALSGSLKKARGYVIASQPDEGGRVYRITSELKA